MGNKNSNTLTIIVNHIQPSLRVEPQSQLWRLKLRLRVEPAMTERGKLFLVNTNVK